MGTARVVTTRMSIVISNMTIDALEDPLTPTLSPRGEGEDCQTLSPRREGEDGQTLSQDGTEVDVQTVRPGEGGEHQLLFRTEKAEERQIFPSGEAGREDSGSAPSPLRGEGWGEGGLSQSQAPLKLQSWFSPAFPIGAYSYSHGLEWAVEAGKVRDRAALIDWLDADLSFGTGRNGGIFFCEAWRRARHAEPVSIVELAELAAAFRGTSEFALEAAQQGSACLATIRKAWPHPIIDLLATALGEARIPATLAIALGVSCAAHGIELELALPLFLQSAIANLVTAAVRLIPLGQTDGQLTLAALEPAVAAASARLLDATLDELGSAAFMLDLASMAHETQYTRLFRS
jgi:urease accessory protein